MLMVMLKAMLIFAALRVSLTGSHSTSTLIFLDASGTTERAMQNIINDSEFAFSCFHPVLNMQCMCLLKCASGNLYRQMEV